jgi:hypothetical protein
MDRLGKRSFSLPTYKICTTADLAELYYTFLWRIFGTFETITSDRGPQFVAEFSKKNWPNSRESRFKDQQQNMPKRMAKPKS